MSNTQEHAYNGNKKHYDNWLLFLQFYPEKSSIDFIFLDTGYGIPTTVRKQKLEVARQWFAKLGKTEFNESDLVNSALNGAFRTRTKKRHRGKGLPKIYKYYNEGYINELNILSNKACITPDKQFDLMKEMTGTLYFWKITKDSINAENIQNNH